jgi:MFS family permease
VRLPEASLPTPEDAELLIDTWTFLLGGLLQTFALDMFSIALSRFVIGFASGFSTVLVPIYLGEPAPPTLRGMLGKKLKNLKIYYFCGMRPVKQPVAGTVLTRPAHWAKPR